jgi:hypothetical protein
VVLEINHADGETDRHDQLLCVHFMHTMQRTHNNDKRKCGRKIAELKNAGKFYQLVRDILWKCQMPKKGKMCLFKSYYILSI